MTAYCPACNRPLPVQDTEARLREACEALGIVIGWDNTVDEAGAARLLHRSPITLRNWRLGERPLAFIQIGSRARYSLAAIAEFINCKNNLD